MTRPATSTDTISLRLASLAQAFDPFDPAPIGTRRLAPDVASYILHRAEECPLDRAFQIVVHLDDGPRDAAQARFLSGAFHAHFHMQSDWERDERHEVFRTGRQFLAIGLLAYAVSALGL